MSVVVGGAFTRSAGVISAIIKQLKILNLKPVKKVTVKFDPFHPITQTARSFLYHTSPEKVRDSNINCVFKTEVVCDRSTPTVAFQLENGKLVVFEVDNLTTLDVLKEFNRIVAPYLPPPEEEALQTKASKSAFTGKAKRRK